MKRKIERMPNGMVHITKEIDMCVMCSKPSDYTKDVPIEQRSGYISGAGQLCESCDKQLVTWDNLF